MHREEHAQDRFRCLILTSGLKVKHFNRKFYKNCVHLSKKTRQIKEKNGCFICLYQMSQQAPI
jgi:hypothetical protein